MTDWIITKWQKNYEQCKKDRYKLFVIVKVSCGPYSLTAEILSVTALCWCLPGVASDR